MTDETKNAPTVLTEKVNKIKVIARDYLRMKLISPRLTKIASYEADLAANAKEVDAVNHEILVENYEIGVLDQNHPDYAETKADKEKVVANDQDTLKALAEDAANTKKAIDEQKAGIADIESGKTKVSLDELNEMVEKLIATEVREEVKVDVA